jgi:type IV secretion system protein VirB11
VSHPADEEGPVYLRSYLAPLADLLARTDVTDIFINRPGEIWVENHAGAVERHEVPELDETMLARLARQIAALSHQGISREHPLLSATLPDGARVQVAAPPATRGALALAIRKHVAQDLSLGDYLEAGAFAETRRRDSLGPSDVDRALAARLDAGDISGMLAMAVRARKNILVSGGTSTGKTTFLNALLREVPAEERLILIEDTPELSVLQENVVGLLAARSELGEAQVSANDLVAASLRMRPDRIILGELRGPEAFAFLRAVNTGHPGSMTTVHADSAERAIEQIVLLVLQSGARLGRDDVRHYVKSTVDIFVQLSRIGGRRSVAEVVLQSGAGEQAVAGDPGSRLRTLAADGPDRTRVAIA